MIDFTDKKVTVMGLGLHGGAAAVAKWLLSQGARVCVTDMKTEAELKASVVAVKEEAIRLKRESFLSFHLGGHQEEDFIQVDMVVKNPGVPRKSKWLELARLHNVKIHNEASLFFLLCQSPIIAVTGSKGKSTTTALLGEIFQQASPQIIVAGNIKTTPMFAVIDKVRGKSRAPYVILELSSWQLEMLSEVKKSPQTAIITNIKPEHLNTYDSLDDYFQAKLEIVKYQSEGDNIILNFDDKRLREFGRQLKREVVWFSLKEKVKKGVHLDRDLLVWEDNGEKERILQVADSALLGEHNIANIAAAAAAAKVYDLGNELIKKGVHNFKGLAGRQELIREFKGRKFYNDTTATAPAATVAALNSFDQKVILIAGGTDKNLPVGDLVKEIRSKTKFVILLPGTGTDKLLKEFKSFSFQNYALVDSMPEAVQAAYDFSQTGDVIILSPGFASFGLFVHEFDRGEQFNKAVSKLK